MYNTVLYGELLFVLFVDTREPCLLHFKNEIKD